MRTIITRAERERAAEMGHSNDAQQLLERLTKEGAWFRFQLDRAGRVSRIAWATLEQRANALRYFRIVIQDNTFNTNE